MLACRIVKPADLDPRPPVVVDVRFAPFDVYIGRRAPRARDPRCHHSSIWANPFVVGRDGERGECSARFGELMALRLGMREPRAGELFELNGVAPWRRAVLGLEGLRLGCWCRGKSGRGHPGQCHGDVLVELWKQLREART